MAIVLLACALNLCSTLFASAAVADDVEPTLPNHRVALNFDLATDLSVTVAGAALWASAELSTGKLAASNCRWCDRDAQGKDDLNAFDASLRRGLRWRDTRTAGTLSGIFSFGLAPAAGTGIAILIAAHDDRLNEIPADVLIVAESAVITLDVADATKFAAGRERPDVHARSAAERQANRSSSDNLSFFSGHASLAFALATSAGTVASMRRHRLAPVMWIAGLTFATTGAYLRIAADRHYATDVLAGALVGSAVGFSVPYFAHSPRRVRVAAMPVEGGQGLSVAGTW